MEHTIYVSVDDAINNYEKLGSLGITISDMNNETIEILKFLKEEFPSSLIPYSANRIWEIYDRLQVTSRK